MTWVRIDDRAPTHPKLRDAGPEAAWLWLSGLCWCNGHHTDGLIRAADLDCLSPGTWTPETLAELAQRLVSVGLWHADGANYRVHDYEQFQAEALRENVDERREYERKRKAAQRAAKKALQEAQAPPDLSRGDSPGHVPGTSAGHVPGTRAGQSPGHAQGHTSVVSQPPDPTRPDPTRPDLRANAPVALARDPSAVRELFEHWREATGKRGARLDDRRKRRLEWALARYSAEDVRRAIDGYAGSAWHRGDNDRGRAFLDLTLMLRDAEHVERGIEMASGASAAPAASVAGEKRELDAWLAELERLAEKGHEHRLAGRREEAARVDARRAQIESVGPRGWAESRGGANGGRAPALHAGHRDGAQRDAVAGQHAGAAGAS